MGDVPDYEPRPGGVLYNQHQHQHQQSEAQAYTASLEQGMYTMHGTLQEQQQQMQQQAAQMQQQAQVQAQQAYHDEAQMQAFFLAQNQAQNEQIAAQMGYSPQLQGMHMQQVLSSEMMQMQMQMHHQMIYQQQQMQQMQQMHTSNLMFHHQMGSGGSGEGGAAPAPSASSVTTPPALRDARKVVSGSGGGGGGSGGGGGGGSSSGAGGGGSGHGGRRQQHQVAGGRQGGAAPHASGTGCSSPGSPGSASAAMLAASSALTASQHAAGIGRGGLAGAISPSSSGPMVSGIVGGGGGKLGVPSTDGRGASILGAEPPGGLLGGPDGLEGLSLSGRVAGLAGATAGRKPGRDAKDGGRADDHATRGGPLGHMASAGGIGKGSGALGSVANVHSPGAAGGGVKHGGGGGGGGAAALIAVQQQPRGMAPLPALGVPPSSSSTDMQPASGIIFGCTSTTYDECHALSMVGLPRKYLPLVRSIKQGHTLSTRRPTPRARSLSPDLGALLAPASKLDPCH